MFELYWRQKQQQELPDLCDEESEERNEHFFNCQQIMTPEK